MNHIFLTQVIKKTGTDVDLRLLEPEAHVVSTLLKMYLRECKCYYYYIIILFPCLFFLINK